MATFPNSLAVDLRRGKGGEGREEERRRRKGDGGERRLKEKWSGREGKRNGVEKGEDGGLFYCLPCSTDHYNGPDGHFVGIGNCLRRLTYAL